MSSPAKPILTNGTISLRAYQPGDVEEVFAAVRESIAEIRPWMAWCHNGYTLEETRAWCGLREEDWECGREYAFAIVDAVDGRFLGSCGLNAIHPLHRFANLGYWIRTSQMGRGIAVAATKLLASWGFEELKLRRIEIVCAVGNLRSQRVAEKAGAFREGVLRQRLLHGEVSQDAVMFSLVAEG
jgi:RimJ/RimL family protein N-acetyltransferase